MDEQLIKHVYGNVMRIAIPLTQRIRTLSDGIESEEEEDFYPQFEQRVREACRRIGIAAE